MSDTMRYAYFPGCSAAGTSIPYTLSAGFIAKKIGLELVEIPDWNCCGTSAALVTDRDLAVALPARSLAIAEHNAATAGLDVATPCAGCFASLKSARDYAASSEQRRARVEAMIGESYSATADVFSFLELMAQEAAATAIEQAIQDAALTLAGLKVACYYGCALVRPASICRFDDNENPQSMDRLVALTGAEPVEWAFKTECCGASHQMTEPAAARQLIERIFVDAAANGAELIATACPLCMLNLDLRLAEVNKRRQEAGQTTFDIPVFYFTELLGLCMGGGVRQLGIDRHFHPAEPQAKRLRTLQQLAEEQAAREAAEAAEAARQRDVRKEEAARKKSEAAADAVPAAAGQGTVADEKEVHA
ncbi:MAG: CoB--CoM heterodisulfide reductase iron-sulfur subunit B family protein [Actinomycetia bacterium]|nr:CoB--CoM heterodisulfide reductase iron-sulfur subunit B family protein [Actinomycetes bacterium]